MTTPYEMGVADAIKLAGIPLIEGFRGLLETGGALADAGVSRIAPHIPAALGGGVLGAGAGAVAADDGDRLRGALRGGAVGGALGLGGSVASKGLGRLSENMDGAGRAIRHAVFDAAEYATPSIRAGTFDGSRALERHLADDIANQFSRGRDMADAGRQAMLPLTAGAAIGGGALAGYRQHQPSVVERIKAKLGIG